MGTIIGIISHIGEVVKLTDKFTKQEFIIETLEEFKQQLGVEIINDNIKFLDATLKDTPYTFHYSLYGRAKVIEGKIKLYNAIRIWKITGAL